MRSILSASSFFRLPGNKRDPLLVGIKMVPGGKPFARNLRLRLIRQRMADVADFDAVPRIKLLLKRKDHNHLADIFLDLLHASGTPCPDLRADKVKNWNAQAMQLTRQTQVEVGEVDQDGCVRFALRGFRHQMLEAAANVRQVPDHLHQSHHGNLIGVDQSSAPDARIFSPPIPKRSSLARIGEGTQQAERHRCHPKPRQRREGNSCREILQSEASKELWPRISANEHESNQQVRPNINSRFSRNSRLDSS